MSEAEEQMQFLSETQFRELKKLFIGQIIEVYVSSYLRRRTRTSVVPRPEHRHWDYALITDIEQSFSHVSVIFILHNHAELRIPAHDNSLLLRSLTDTSCLRRSTNKVRPTCTLNNTHWFLVS